MNFIGSFVDKVSQLEAQLQNNKDDSELEVVEVRGKNTIETFSILNIPPTPKPSESSKFEEANMRSIQSVRSVLSDQSKLRDIQETMVKLQDQVVSLKMENKTLKKQNGRDFDLI